MMKNEIKRLGIIVHIASSPKDPRDAVVLKKGSTADCLKSLHKGAVVRKTCKKLPLYDTCRSHLKL